MTLEKTILELQSDFKKLNDKIDLFIKKNKEVKEVEILRFVGSEPHIKFTLKGD